MTLTGKGAAGVRPIAALVERARQLVQMLPPVEHAGLYVMAHRVSGPEPREPWVEMAGQPADSPLAQVVAEHGYPVRFEETQEQQRVPGFEAYSLRLADGSCYLITSVAGPPFRLEAWLKE